MNTVIFVGRIFYLYYLFEIGFSQLFLALFHVNVASADV